MLRALDVEMDSVIAMKYMENTSTQEILESIAMFAGQMDQRFDGVDQRLDGIDQRLDKMDQRFDGVDHRLDGIDQRLDKMDQRFDGVDQRFDGVDQRFDSLESEIMGAIHGLAQHMDEHFLEQDKRFDKKFEDFKTDIVLLTKKSSIKLTVLVDRLVAEGSLKRATGDFILAMEPFAQ